MTDSPDQLASLAKALAHPARLRVLEALGTRGECLCGEVVEVVGLAQSTVSQHLKVLREAGLVKGTVDGPRTCYCLSPSGLATARHALTSLFDSLQSCCDGDDCC
ncbi:MAG: metalloregulator ArsR/SmtB family transcription factor [Bacteroidota bacterium]